MAITVPTKDEIREALQATLKALLPDIVVTKDTDIGVRIDMLVEALFGVHRQVKTVLDDAIVSDRTSTEGLDLHADARLVGGRKGAVLASGTDAVEATGTDGSTVSIDDAMTFEDGTEYKVTSGVVIASGVGTISVEAVTPGVVGNRDVGETLSFTSPPTGITADATVTVAITGGQDQETDAELLARLLDAFKNPPAGGTFGDYRQQSQTVEGVLTAYTYGPSSATPNGRRGLGLVDIAILGRGTAATRVPSTTVKGNVEDVIHDLRPAPAKDFLVLRPTTTLTDIEVLVTPEPGFEFDWTKNAAVLVFDYDSATRTLIVDEVVTTFASVRAPVAGDRILVGVGGATATRGHEINTIKTITSPAPAGKATIIVEDDFAVDPLVGDSFEPAGPLSAPTIAAAKAYMDGLGPARELASTASSGPDPEQIWDDKVRVNNLLCAVLDVNGVKTVAAFAPAVDVDAVDPGTTTAPELLVYADTNLRPPLGV